MRSIAIATSRSDHGAIIAVEGSDAAGKGGAIRRLTAELDPRHYKVWPIGPPSDEALAHPYLWRFWRQLPLAGGSPSQSRR